MKRVSIGDLVRETGLSRATIDRALNGRNGVHPRTRQVIDHTLERLGAVDPVETLEASSDLGIDMVLRTGSGMLQQMRLANQNLNDAVTIHDMYQKGDADMLDRIRDLCRDPSRGLILTAKATEALRSELVQARKRGKFVVTVVSDLSHDSRDAFVGIDNRMAGQTAAHIIGNLLGHREAVAGVVLGDYSYSCHEDREIGFRSCLRAYFPSIGVADAAKGDDSQERTFDAVKALIAANPHVDAIYNVAGGNAGLTEAIAAAGRTGTITVVAHEANHVTVPEVRRDRIQFVLAQDTADLLDRAIELVKRRGSPDGNEIHLVDFGIYTKFNLPRFAVVSETPG